MRFPIRMDPVWRPALLAGGATPGRSYVDVSADEVLFRFGFWFRQSIPRSEIVSVTVRSWPVWYGVGWRSNLRGVIGLIGSYQGVVEVKLRNRTRAWGVFPCDRIAVSVADPGEADRGACWSIGGDAASCSAERGEAAAKQRRGEEARRAQKAVPSRTARGRRRRIEPRRHSGCRRSRPLKERAFRRSGRGWGRRRDGGDGSDSGERSRRSVRAERASSHNGNT